MSDPEIPTEVPTKFPPAKIPTTSPAYKAGGGNLGWEESRKCTACGLPMQPYFHGQQMHPTCHGDHPPTADCPECLAERRSHRRQVAKQRRQTFIERTTHD